MNPQIPRQFKLFDRPMVKILDRRKRCYYLVRKTLLSLPKKIAFLDLPQVFFVAV